MSRFFGSLRPARATAKGLLGDGAHWAQCGECTRPLWRGVLPKRDDAASAQITPRGNLAGLALAATAYVLLGCSGCVTRYSESAQIRRPPRPQSPPSGELHSTRQTRNWAASRLHLGKRAYFNAYAMPGSISALISGELWCPAPKSP